jgi:AraC-like DNA-binding protein
MDGIVSSHAADPRGEYMVGVIEHRAMRLTRGRRNYVVPPGGLAVLDPSAPHRGSPVSGGPWRCRLMIVELPDVTDLAVDPDQGRFADLWFPEPLVSDDRLAAGFLALHRTLDAPASTLERQSSLAAWWQAVAARAARSGRREPERSGDPRALRRALSLLADDPSANVSLTELASAAGLSPYQLVRSFQTRYGLPPHAFQASQRVTRARRLLETGMSVAQAAATVGFHDQSHLHRHFHRTLGLTPAAYARAFRRDFVQAPPPGHV